MKIIYLIPPSEWKYKENLYKKEKLTFVFEKPLEISKNATQKDLKSIWNRFFDWINLNSNIEKSPTIESIKRYNWEMYKWINYENMSFEWQKYFEKNFLILSWMYWVLKPLDRIWNYKLPIETKWLLDFWGDKITQTLNEIKADVIIDFLPNSYKKMILKKNLNKKIIEVNFLDKKTLNKIAHWSKKIKWEFIRETCEKLWKNITKSMLKNEKIDIFVD